MYCYSYGCYLYIIVIDLCVKFNSLFVENKNDYLTIITIVLFFVGSLKLPRLNLSH